MSDSALAQLDEAQTCHDDDPTRAAELLRRLDPAALPPDRWPGLAFLFNHVVGEKLGAWAETQALFDPLLRVAGDKAGAALWRQAAAAARLAEDEAACARLSKALAASAGVGAAQAEDVVALTAAMYRVPASPAVQAAEVLTLPLQRLGTAAWQVEGPLDVAVAACANNIASGLLERPAPERESLRGPLEAYAVLAERFWLRAGNWIQHERAAYLRAMVANALGDASQARAHALRALALLDENDQAQAEQVDRAFIQLERARACRELGMQGEAQQAQDDADILAAAFNDEALDAWFDRRRAELGAARRAGL